MPVTVSVMEVVTGGSVARGSGDGVVGYAPATVVEATVKVTTLDVVDDAGLNAAVTPVGMPDAAKVTLPVNGLMSVTVMVSVPLAPGATDKVAAEGFSVKLPLPVTVSEMEVVALSVPEVAVIVIGYVPATVDAATDNVTKLEVVDEAGLNAAKLRQRHAGRAARLQIAREWTHVSNRDGYPSRWLLGATR